MKDKKGIEVEVGDRVRFGIFHDKNLDSVGKVIDIVDHAAYIWGVGDTNSLTPYKRAVVEIIQ